MNYKIIRNFLSNKDCENLVIDGKKFINSKNYQKINVNRNSINSSSDSYLNLCTNSNTWEKVSKKLQSEDFLKYCFDELKIDKSQYNLKEFYNSKKKSKFIKLFKKVGLSQVKSLKSLTLIKYLILRFLINLEKKIRFNIFTSILKKPLELLYDYSVAGKGYFREIHRDSDSRLVVFLIYLNKIDDNKFEKGGQLELYQNLDINDKKPQPKKESCKLLKSIEPEEGMLIIFSNTDESFHAVKKIESENTERHFIYGAYTLLNGKNPFIKKSEKLKTEFNFYE
jgi:Rps23 Pro-64 3,4-dihydroxylase Tpa1-like proline 4-hydroxylase